MLLCRSLRAFNAAAPRLSSLAPAVRAAAPPRTTALRAAAFLSPQQRSMSAEAQLLDKARSFVAAWGRGPEAADQLRALISSDISFKADGVVWHRDLQGPDAIIDGLQRSHKKYFHHRYEPVAAAANASDNAAFVAVAWEYEPLGNDGTPCGPKSHGLSLEEFLFDGEGRINVQRVSRQLTPQERKELLKDEGAASPADLWNEVVPELQRRAGATPGDALETLPQAEPQSLDLARAQSKMLANLTAFDAAWGSEGPGVEKLRELCAPDMRILDGYGMHGSGASYGLEDAQSMISGLRDKSYSKQSQVHIAVNAEQKVGFSRWEGTVIDKDNEERQMQLGGFDLALFDDSCRIAKLVQFTMRPYKQARAGAKTDAPAPAE